VERVRCLLLNLFRQALNEHGREAPALTAISIESSVGWYDPSLPTFPTGIVRKWPRERKTFTSTANVIPCGTAFVMRWLVKGVKSTRR
jgi:hypothetical protein